MGIQTHATTDREAKKIDREYVRRVKERTGSGSSESGCLLMVVATAAGLLLITAALWAFAF